MKRPKILTPLFVFALIAFPQLSPVFAQEKVFKEGAARQSGSAAAVAQESASATAEEKIVRWAYKKMNILDAVERISKAKKQGQLVGRALGLKTLRFTLSNFHAGPIQEIQNAVYRDLVTPPTGQIIQVSAINSTRDNGEPKISIKTAWQAGQYASGFDPKWTIGDVLQLEAARFHDVNRYASYEVTVSLEERARTYRALVLFHDSYQAGGVSNPEFLDSVTGMGGIITQIFKDTRQPLGLRRSSTQDSALSQGTVQTSSTVALNATYADQFDFMCGPDTCSRDGCIEWYVTPIDPSYTYCMTWDSFGGGDGGGTGGSSGCTASASTSNYPQFYNIDSAYHLSGNHEARTSFQSSCSVDTSCTQTCDVVVADSGYGDSGTLDEILYYHAGASSVSRRSGTGSKSSSVSCETAVGYSFKRCIIDCGVSVTVGVSGQGTSASVTVTGGDLWNVGHIQGRTCTNGR